MPSVLTASALKHVVGALQLFDISTDFVFDGAQSKPYVESDAAHPLNVYGMTKQAGEILVRTANPHHYIVRMSAVFGVAGSSGKGGNFVETMVAKARAGASLAWSMTSSWLRRRQAMRRSCW